MAVASAQQIKFHQQQQLLPQPLSFSILNPEHNRNPRNMINIKSHRNLKLNKVNVFNGWGRTRVKLRRGNNYGCFSIQVDYKVQLGEPRLSEFHFQLNLVLLLKLIVDVQVSGNDSGIQKCIYWSVVLSGLFETVDILRYFIGSSIMHYQIHVDCYNNNNLIKIICYHQIFDNYLETWNINLPCYEAPITFINILNNHNVIIKTLLWK